MRDEVFTAIITKFARQTLTFSTWAVNWYERRLNGEIHPELQEAKVQLARLKSCLEELEDK